MNCDRTILQVSSTGHYHIVGNFGEVFNLEILENFLKIANLNVLHARL